MSKAFAFVSNNVSQTITGGGAINPGTAQHGFGCTCGSRTIHANGNNINIAGNGYYAISVGTTVSGSAAGNVTLSLYQDGNLIAQSTETIAAAGDPANISFPVGVQVNCGTTLTLVATASAGNPIISNVYTTILKA